MTLTSRKSCASIGVALLAGLGIGLVLKDYVDQANTASANESSVQVRKVPDSEIGKSNHLISPQLWDVYLDPLWVPVDLTARALPLIPLMSFPSDVPKVQTFDQDNELRIVAQVPGLSEKDVDVQVSDKALTIKGHKVKEEKDASRFESVNESFQQTINLPCNVSADKVQANVKDGILTVLLPKTRG